VVAIHGVMTDNNSQGDTIPEYLTRRQSQINIIGMGPSRMNERTSENEKSALTPTDHGILHILFHNYKQFLPLEMWFSTAAIARSLSRTPAYIKERVDILEKEYGLIERADQARNTQIRLTTIGAAVMEGKMRVSDAREWHHQEEFNYDELSLENTVERAVGRELKEFMNWFEDEWSQAKEEFKQLHQKTMESNFKHYAEARADGRALAVKNRRVAFDGLTEEIKVQFEKDREFYQTLHEELSTHVMEMLSAEIHKACQSALSR